MPSFAMVVLKVILGEGILKSRTTVYDFVEGKELDR